MGALKIPQESMQKLAKLLSNHVQLSNKAARYFHEQAAAAQTQKSASENVVGAVVDSLIESGVIYDHEKSAAVRKLSDHEGALHILKKAAAQIAELQKEKAEQEKKAAAAAGIPLSPGGPGSQGATSSDRFYQSHGGSEDGEVYGLIGAGTSKSAAALDQQWLNAISPKR